MGRTRKYHNDEEIKQEIDTLNNQLKITTDAHEKNKLYKRIRYWKNREEFSVLRHEQYIKSKPKLKKKIANEKLEKCKQKIQELNQILQEPEQ